MRTLKIVDFSVHHGSGFVFNFSEPDASKREEAVWRQIDRAFSEPTTAADDTADYVPIQVNLPPARPIQLPPRHVEAAATLNDPACRRDGAHRR